MQKNYLPYFCDCGCKEICTYGKRYVSGHNSRVENPFSGKFHSDATKSHWSNTRKGKNTGPRPLDVKQKISKKLQGHPVSERQKLEYSLSRTGKKNKNKMPESFGIKLAERNRKNWQDPEYRKSILPKISGPLGSNWLGGRSFEPYGIEFNKNLKELIRKRDNYQCQECDWFQKDLGYKLPVHHIDYDKKNIIPENLISLCKSCHAQTNFERTDWMEYFRNGRTQN